jgi:hypothetical protein
MIVLSLPLLASLFTFALVLFELVVLPGLHLGTAALAHRVVGLLGVSLALPVGVLGSAPGEFRCEVRPLCLFCALTEYLFSLQLRHACDPPPVCLIHVLAVQGVGHVCSALRRVVVAVRVGLVHGV